MAAAKGIDPFQVYSIYDLKCLVLWSVGKKNEADKHIGGIVIFFFLNE